MAEYQKNNIIFRIASADAISKFKARQASALLQLTRKDIGFEGAPKEAVLLEYDMLSHWLYKIERICLIAGHGDATPELVEVIIQSFRDECRTLQNVMESHLDVFESTIIAYTKIIHNYSVKMFVAYIRNNFKNISNTNAFVSISTFISDYLDHFLISMHELNGNLMNKNGNEGRPVMSGTDFCAEINIDDSSEPCILRAKFFKEHGCGNLYEFKNYSSKDTFEYVREKLNKINIELIPEIINPEEASIIHK